MAISKKPMEPQRWTPNRRHSLKIPLESGEAPWGTTVGAGNRPAPRLLNKFDRSSLSGTPGVITLKTDQLFAWARTSSLWPLTFGLACCAIEMMSTYMAHHDLDLEMRKVKLD